VFFSDLRYAVRGLARSRGLTAIIVLTLGLGVGANTAIFSVVSGVLLEPLPYGEPDRLVTVWENNLASPNTMGQVSPPNFADWLDQSHTFEAMAAAHYWAGSISGDEGASRILGAVVTHDMFSDVLRVSPHIGRLFTIDDGRADAAPTVILGYELWMREFGGDRDLIGGTIPIGGRSYEVVGVMQPRFHLPVYAEAEMFRPLTSDLYSEDRSSHYLRVIARLKPAVALEQARVEMATTMSRLEEEHPEHNADVTTNVVPLRRYIVGDVQRALYVLLGAVGFVLLIACANVASLLLARASVREREFAVRQAIGAKPARLARQLVTESLVLGVAGGAAGLLLAYWGVELLLALGPGAFLPRIDHVAIDGRVLAFTLAVTFATGLIVGIVPALRSARPQLVDTLKTGSAAAGSARDVLQARRTLVIAQVAVALMLVGGAGLMIRSFGKLIAEDVGFEAEALATARVSVGARYPDGSTRIAFVDDLLERLGRHVDVGSVAASSAVPFTSWEVNSSFEIVGRPPPEPNQEPDARIATSTPGYFSTMEIPLVRGRDFGVADGPNAPGVAIINESAARSYWPGEDPIGQRIHLGGWDPEGFEREIIGIVGDVRFYALDREPSPELYMPYRQMPASVVSIVARVVGDPSRFVRVMRDDIRTLDRDVAVNAAATIGQLIGRTAASDRFYMIVLGIFAAVATLLAAVGIYGILSYTVARRASEIGVRVALGAGPGDVLARVIGDGARMAGLGLAAGLIGWLALGRLLTPLLHEVPTVDPLTVASTVLLIALIAFLASYLPARRASRVDPVTVLRSE
jgi:putative ABC transport system permease protein